jgi:replicative DNA helicase
MHNLREISGKMPGAAEGEELVVDRRVPPHDLDAEGAILSAVMLNVDDLPTVAKILAPEHFYSEAHRRIYEACVELTSKGRPVDVVLVASWLRDHDRLAQVGGMAYLTEILSSAPISWNVAAYAKVVYEKWRVRQLILACQRIVAEGYAAYGEAQAFLDKAERAVGDIARGRTEPEPSL